MRWSGYPDNWNLRGTSRGAMVLDYYFGRPAEDMSYQEEANKDKLYEVAGIAKLLYGKFIKKYGAMSCATIQQKLYGRIYWATDPDVNH